jgi:hypothetical protein
MKEEVMSHPIPRWTNVSALVLAPAVGLVAAVAVPGLSTSTKGELAQVAAHPERFHIYALAIAISGYLMVAAVFGLMALLRERSPRTAYLAGGLTQIGTVVAVGDGAVELMYWKMGVVGHRDLMVTLSDRYDAGTGWIYTVGGLSIIVGSIALAVGLWRTGTLARWAAVTVPLGVVLNIVGFATASQPTLIVSYLVLLAGFARAALTLVDRDQVTVPLAAPATA